MFTSKQVCCNTAFITVLGNFQLHIFVIGLTAKYFCTKCEGGVKFESNNYYFKQPSLVGPQQRYRKRK